MPPKPPIRLPSKPSLPAKPRFPTASAVNASKPRPYQPPPPASKPYASTTSTLPAPPPPISRTTSALAKTFSFVLIGSLIFVTIIDNVVTIDTVRGSSMAPSLSPLAHETGKKDKVIINRIAPTKSVKRGDIITFWKPHRRGEISIKRVVGVAGDVVYPARGYALEDWSSRTRVELWDGLPSPEELEADVEGEMKGRVVVPHNHVWVEGDNWRNSFDSNDFGPVSLALMDGKAVKVWREWGFRDVKDERGERKSRVLEGKAVTPVPEMFARE